MSIEKIYVGILSFSTYSSSEEIECFDFYYQELSNYKREIYKWKFN